MAEDYGETQLLSEENDESKGEKSNNTVWIIVAVVAAVLLCCCILSIMAVIWLWNTGGDLLLENIGWSLQSILNQA